MKEKTRTLSFIKPISLAKITSLLFVVVASILGVVSYITYAVVFYTSQSTGNPLPPNTTGEPLQNLATLEWGIVASVLILYALSGFFIGYVGAVVYNILAPRIGGVEFSFKEKQGM